MLFLLTQPWARQRRRHPPRHNRPRRHHYRWLQSTMAGHSAVLAGPDLKPASRCRGADGDAGLVHGGGAAAILHHEGILGPCPNHQRSRGHDRAPEASQSPQGSRRPAGPTIMATTSPQKQHLSQRRVFTLTLRPEPDCPDVIKALRFGLKSLLRQHRLKCISIAEVPGESHSPLRAHPPTGEA